VLSYSNIEAGYGGLMVLWDVSFTVNEGEAAAIFGHNGAGKITLLKCSLGDVAGLKGSVHHRGARIVPGSVFLNVRRDIGFVPQGHNVFRHLSERQNLAIAGLEDGGGARDQVYHLFPILSERWAQIAGSLSGGQQQIPALGMALMTKPLNLLLDEPSSGLAPVIVRDVMASLAAINRDTGTTGGDG
jgi:branched-chain amino acid transport system ATP-binding protein